LQASDYYDLGCFLQLAAVNVGLNSSARYNVEKACRAVEIYTANWAFEVRDSSGVPVAWFDDLGNLTLKGGVTEETTPSPSGNDEFRVQNSGGMDVAIIDATNGNMYITGSLHEEQETLTPSGQSDEFIIKNSSGAVVAYIDAAGDLDLKGRLYEPKE
jgi:hypothetical protein